MESPTGLIRGFVVVQFMIANLVAADATFEVPSALGQWEFVRAPNYGELIPRINNDACGNTYYACNAAITPRSSDTDFITACDEIVDICLVLSFLTARCVAPTGAIGEITFIATGDTFIRPRAIVGFGELQVRSLTALFSNWLTTSYTTYRQRHLRLQLSHWLSGLTCFSLEDIYLSVSVQMDIIKQREIAAMSSNFTFFQGMVSASTNYGLTPLGQDFKNMRNDIVHEGVLSGTNFPSKSKSDCSSVAASTLNWIDQYIISVLSVASHISYSPRWNGPALQHGLPAHTVR